MIKVEALRTWLNKRPAGADHVALVCDRAIGVYDPVGEWTAEEVKTSDVAQAIADASQDFADSEGAPDGAKFSVRWIGVSGKQVAVRSHRCKPAPDAIDTPTTVTDAGSQVEVIQLLCRTIDSQQKQINNSLRPITEAYDKAITILAAQLEASIRREVEAREDPRLQTQEPSPEQREESIQRANALAAFSGKLPEILDLALAAATSHLLPAETKQ